MAIEAKEGHTSPSGDPQVHWQKNLGILWIGVFLACASYTSCVPFLPLYLWQDLQVGPENIHFWTGAVFSVTFLGSSLMAPYWGAWADKVGQRKMAIRAGIGLAVTYALLGLVQTAFQLFLVRGLAGIISGFVPAAMSLVSSSLPQERIGWGMGIMQTGVASGSILGPLFGGYLSAWFGMRASFWLGAVSLFLATVMVIFQVEEMPYIRNARKEKLHLLRDLSGAVRNRGLRFVMTMVFLVQVCTLLVQPLVTMYVADFTGTTGEETIKLSGWVFSLAGIAGIVAAPFWGRQGQRRGYVRTLLVVLTCAGLVNLFQPAVRSLWQFAAIQFCSGLFVAGSYPNVTSILTQVTPPEMRGKAFGLVTSAQQFGGVVGPLVGSALGSFLPIRYVLFLVGLVYLLASCYTRLMKNRLHQWIAPR